MNIIQISQINISRFYNIKLLVVAEGSEVVVLKIIDLAVQCVYRTPVPWMC
jgi:hypothetical protein